jgi:hypothetical protein
MPPWLTRELIPRSPCGPMTASNPTSFASVGLEIVDSGRVMEEYAASSLPGELRFRRGGIGGREIRIDEPFLERFGHPGKIFFVSGGGELGNPRSVLLHPVLGKTERLLDPAASRERPAHLRVGKLYTVGVVFTVAVRIFFDECFRDRVQLVDRSRRLETELVEPVLPDQSDITRGDRVSHGRHGPGLSLVGRFVQILLRIQVRIAREVWVERYDGSGLDQLDHERVHLFPGKCIGDIAARDHDAEFFSVQVDHHHREVQLHVQFILDELHRRGRLGRKARNVPAEIVRDFQLDLFVRGGSFLAVARCKENRRKER